MLLRNAWYIAAWADEIGGQPLARRICNEPVVLFRDAGGRAAALADRCCHRAAPLHMGNVIEEGLQCGYHGLVFDAAGRCVRIPGQKQIPADARVRSYPAVEKDQLVWVWMGEPAQADPAQIVDFPYHNDRAHWPNKHDVYPIKGNYMLMVDNLMDLTHLGYLHAKTVGGNPSAHVDAEMKTVRTASGLKFTRWMRNSVPPPTYVKAAGFAGRVDRWQEFEFVAPSTVLQWTGAADAGNGAYEGNRDGGFQFRLFHGLTPETETSCFYFWSVANGYRQDDPEATEQLYREIAPTFVEDRVMVEAQQARLDEFGESGLVDIASDAARMHMRRVVERLLAAEESAALAAE
ncbi:MAG: aromatic ring-hydroxylating dioxygenase subunit alpha [Alphaproteobacteria bacterium]|nr:aromatic ring-hydroxylating dioxygenase subunit alpha [Alphaproteobacteria bacterium]